MENDSDPMPEDPQYEGRSEFPGCAGVIVKLIIGAVVLFVVAVAFVFGVCFLG